MHWILGWRGYSTPHRLRQVWVLCRVMLWTLYVCVCVLEHLLWPHLSSLLHPAALRKSVSSSYLKHIYCWYVPLEHLGLSALLKDTEVLGNLTIFSVNKTLLQAVWIISFQITSPNLESLKVHSHWQLLNPWRLPSRCYQPFLFECSPLLVTLHHGFVVLRTDGTARALLDWNRN